MRQSRIESTKTKTAQSTDSRAMLKAPVASQEARAEIHWCIACYDDCTSSSLTDTSEI